MLKRHLSLAVALSLACGLAFAEPHDARPMPVAVAYYNAQDLADATGPRLVPAVYLVSSVEDYRHPAMRSDMRVASAGLVFEQVSMAEAPPGSIWM
jgi:hypothetical protein